MALPDFTSFASSVANMGGYVPPGFQAIVSGGGQMPLEHLRKMGCEVPQGPDNPLAGLEAIGGQMPPFPQEASQRVAIMQQGFSEIEKERRDNLEEEVAARADAYYAQREPPETATERAARIEFTNRQRESIMEQVSARTAQFSQMVQAEISKIPLGDPEYQEKLHAIEAQFGKVQADMEAENMRALLKAGLPTELYGMVDEKVAGYNALVDQHKQQLESSPDYQLVKQYQEQQTAYVKRLRQSIGGMQAGAMGMPSGSQGSYTEQQMRLYAMQQGRFPYGAS